MTMGKSIAKAEAMAKDVAIDGAMAMLKAIDEDHVCKHSASFIASLHDDVGFFHDIESGSSRGSFLNF